MVIGASIDLLKNVPNKHHVAVFALQKSDSFASGAMKCLMHNVCLNAYSNS